MYNLSEDEVFSFDRKSQNKEYNFRRQRCLCCSIVYHRFQRNKEGMAASSTYLSAHPLGSFVQLYHVELSCILIMLLDN